MADTFGKNGSGRLYDGGRFYATPAADVAANAIFMPAYSTSPLFGVAEYPVKSGQLGSFATEGTFAFAKPAGFTSSAGQAIYYAPTSAVAGTLSASSSAGAVLIGFEVPSNAPADKLCVYLTRPNALEAAASASGTT